MLGLSERNIFSPGRQAPAVFWITGLQHFLVKAQIGYQIIGGRFSSSTWRSR